MVNEVEGFRWTQWVILFALVVVFAATLFLPETYKQQVLERRARRQGAIGPMNAGGTTAEVMKRFFKRTIIRPLHMIATEPVVFCTDLYIAFNFGLLNGFFAAWSLVFQKEYGFGLVDIGLTFLSQVIGSVMGLAIIICVSLYYHRALTAKQGRLPPESKLMTAMMGAPLLPIS